jgi:type II secretory pathway component PulL
MMSPETAPSADAVAGASAAVAAAMAQLTGGQLDLYAAAQGRQGLLETLFAPAAAGLVVLALLFGVLGWRNWTETRALRAEAARLQAAEMELWKSLFADQRPVGDNVLLALQSAAIEAEQTGGEATGDQSRLLLNALLVLSRTAPQGEGLVFNEFGAGRGEVVIRASANDSATAEKLVQAINEEGMFSAQSRNPRTDEGVWKLEIVLTPRAAQ